MTPDRFEEAMTAGTITEAEVAARWRFCCCEWDGLLIKEGHPEAKFCGCFFDANGEAKPFEDEKPSAG